jgi:hypothetical protein
MRVYVACDPVWYPRLSDGTPQNGTMKFTKHYTATRTHAGRLYALADQGYTTNYTHDYLVKLVTIMHDSGSESTRH